MIVIEQRLVFPAVARDSRPSGIPPHGAETASVWDGADDRHDSRRHAGLTFRREGIARLFLGADDIFVFVVIVRGEGVGGFDEEDVLVIAHGNIV